MPARTTAANIRQIMEIDPSLTNLTPFITMANLQVTRHCVGYSEVEDEVLLELIERNLSAHHICMRDPRTSSESVTGVSASYLTTSGKYLEATVFGQTAIGLDENGGLSVLQKKLLQGGSKFSLGWAGVPTESRIRELDDEYHAE